MDKKNLILGIICIGIAVALMITEARNAGERAREAAQNPPPAGETSPDPAKPSGDAGEAQPAEGAPGVFGAPVEDGEEPEALPDILPEPDEAVAAKEETFQLENEYIRVTFSSQGAAIRKVEFIHRAEDGKLEYPAEIGSDEPYAFNESAGLPALALETGEGSRPPEPILYNYEVLNHDREKNVIKFFYKLPSGGGIVRQYSLPERSESEDESSEIDPYVIEHVTVFVNEGKQALPMNRLFFNLGTAPPTEGDVWEEYLNIGYYERDDAKFIRQKFFKGSGGFLGIGRRAPQPFVMRTRINPDTGQGDIHWAAIKNQFFAAVATPDQTASTVFGEPVDLPFMNEDGQPIQGLTGGLGFDFENIEPGERLAVQFDYFVGPKEYFRLATLGHEQEDIMQFGFFAAISILLLWLLVSIHDLVVVVAPTWGWGLAIVLVVIVVRGLLWPLMQIQVRSAKRMQKLAEPMKALREKYPDDQQKLNTEMMKLWKEHRINPAAGCLPLLAQIPIFIALFYMLRTASELRFAPFLWMNDLAVFDPILPLAMAGTMFIQMQLAPAPTTDNMQRWIFKIMPIGMLVFAYIYRFPAGLVLYWTCSNCFSIFQTWWTNKQPEPEALPAKPEKKGKPGQPQKKSFMERMTEAAEKARQQQEERKKMMKSGQGSSAGGGEKGTPYTPAKKKKKK